MVASMSLLISSECLGSLIFDNYKLRKQDISVASNKTCDWLLGTQEFKKWRDRSDITQDNGVFWLKGKPGSGKSTMMRHISHHLQQFDDAVLVEHFFNARGSGLEKTFLGLLRSLIYQLVSKDPEFYNAFVPIYHEKDMIQGLWEWRQNELKNFLHYQLKLTKLKLIILVDALDECRLDEIASVVSFLEELSLEAVEADANLRICLSSRPYPNISMKKDLEFTLDGNAEHDEDIKKYVRAKLKSDNLEIEKMVLQKAHGVFLWVVLVVAMLNKAVERGRPEEMQKTLDDIPSDLDKFFERIIFGDPEKNPETLLMFQFVLFSEKGLNPAELVFAVIAQFQEGYLKTWSQSKMTGDLLKARIIGSSKGLIEVNGEGIVQFIHQTVTDFFLRNRRLERLYDTPEQDVIAASNDRLRACCLDYILKFPIDSQSHSGQSADELNTEYPFLYYSAMNLLSHTETALQGHQLGVETAKWLQSPDPWFQTWKRIVSAIDSNWYFDGYLNVGLVYILLLYDFHNFLSAVLRCSDVDVNTQGGYFNNALQLAVTKRDENTTRMLLERNANVHLNGGYFGTVLQIASAQGNCSLVCTILEKGADLNALGGLYGTALQAAAARGKIRILKTLLERGAKVNISGGIYGSALQGAAHSGNLEAVNLLLEHGALVNSDGGIYGSALHAAMEPRKTEIFRRLLQAGADVNSCGRIYGSWLDLDEMLDQHLPSIRSSSVLPRLKGTTFSLEYAPVIVWAARNLDYDQIKLLLENGADVNSASGHWRSDVPVAFCMKHDGSFDFELGMTALIWAARNGKRDIIELLLDYGADIEARSSSGQTALLAGSEAGHEGAVRFLIERGANPSAKDNFGQNALFKAAANGYVDTMRLLLSHEDFHYTQNKNLRDFNVIRDPKIKTAIVNGGFSTVWPFGDRIWTSANDYPIQCLVVNGGFLYIGPEMRHDRVFIKSFQINGGTCYFDMDYQLHIQKLEMNGGSFHLRIQSRHLRINNIELKNGHLSISAPRVDIDEILLLGGSFNCNSRLQVYVEHVKMGNTLSHSSERQSIADPQSTCSLPDIDIKNSNDRIEQHGIAQPGEQNIQISTILSPLYVAAQNGHLEAVQLLLQSGAKYDKVWPTMNPLEIAELNGHDEIVRLLQEKGQEEEINGNKKQRTMRTYEKRKRKK